MLVHGVGNDICKDAKRQIISIEDVFTALEDLEFTELLPALKESLEGKPLYHCLLVKVNLVSDEVIGNTHGSFPNSNTLQIHCYSNKTMPCSLQGREQGEEQKEIRAGQKA